MRTIYLQSFPIQRKHMLYAFILISISGLQIQVTAETIHRKRMNERDCVL